MPAEPPASSRPGPRPAAGRQDGGGPAGTDAGAPRSAPKPTVSSMRATSLNWVGAAGPGVDARPGIVKPAVQAWAILPQGFDRTPVFPSLPRAPLAAGDNTRVCIRSTITARRFVAAYLSLPPQSVASSVRLAQSIGRRRDVAGPWCNRATWSWGHWKKSVSSTAGLADMGSRAGGSPRQKYRRIRPTRRPWILTRSAPNRRVS